MKRRDALKALAGLAVAPSFVGEAGAFQGASEDTSLPGLMKKLGPMIGSIPVTVAPLRSGLSLIAGPGGNIAALPGPDGILLVDSFVPQGADALLAEVRKLDKGPITLINTHWHFDHTGGNTALASAGAKILAHEDARKRLSTDQVMADYEMKVPASPPGAWPVLTIGDSATLYHNGEEIQLTHVAPAHTDGDVFVHFRKANVLHTGDLFTNGGFCNIDSSSEGWIGGMVAAADRILAIADASTKIIPGHGPVGTRDDYKAFRDMLAEVQAKIEPLVDAGKSLAEVVAARPIANLDAKWGRGPFKAVHFSQLAYNGLARRKNQKTGA